MTLLPTDLRVGGFDLHQIKRQGKFAVYEQRIKGILTSYEVIEIQKNKAQVIMGKEYPARESYPSSEKWGTCAWTTITLERANEIFEQLCA